jgi:hypothetical protein
VPVGKTKVMRMKGRMILLEKTLIGKGPLSCGRLDSNIDKFNSYSTNVENRVSS